MRLLAYPFANRPDPLWVTLQTPSRIEALQLLRVCHNPREVVRLRSVIHSCHPSLHRTAVCRVPAAHLGDLISIYTFQNLHRCE